MKLVCASNYMQSSFVCVCFGLRLCGHMWVVCMQKLCLLVCACAFVCVCFSVRFALRQLFFEFFFIYFLKNLIQCVCLFVWLWHTFHGGVCGLFESVFSHSFKTCH